MRHCSSFFWFTSTVIQKMCSANLDFFDLVRARTPSKRRITYFDVTSAPCGLFIEGERQYRRAIPTFALSEWERSLTEQMRDELGAQRGNLSESDLREMLGHMEVLVGIGEAPIGAIEQWKDLCQARKSRKYLIAQIVLLREMYARGISLLELYYAYEHTELNRFEEVFDHINALHHLQEVPELSASDFYDENGRPYELGIGRIN